jgi:hypothetical protein
MMILVNPHTRGWPAICQSTPFKPVRISRHLAADLSQRWRFLPDPPLDLPWRKIFDGSCPIRLTRFVVL